MRVCSMEFGSFLGIEDFYYLRKISGAMKNPRTRFNDTMFIEEGEDYLLPYLADNVGPVDETRRKFIKGVVFGIGAIAAASVLDAVRGLQVPLAGENAYVKMLLVDSTGTAVKASSVPVNNPVIVLYEYPLTNEINFLLNLGDTSGNPLALASTSVTIPENGSTYTFPGGVGANKSIVSYSAICQHLGCKPPNIHYYPPQYMKTGLTFPDFLPPDALAAAQKANLPGIIHCDCHGSTYDPYHGAAVITGPTQRPLPSTVLEWDSSTDQLYATGSIGVPVYGHTSTLSGGTTVSGTSSTVSNSSNPFTS